MHYLMKSLSEFMQFSQNDSIIDDYIILNITSGSILIRVLHISVPVNNSLLYLVVVYDNIISNA
jgi:hypothetical protein